MRLTKLSDYYKKIKDINNISVGKVKNFDANSYDKERYVLHCKNLHLYLKFGVLKFDQSRWLKPCIGFNTEQGKNASNEFENWLIKLMNNRVCNKTIISI